MILEDSSSNSSDDNVVFGMNGLGDDGRKGLEDDGMKGLEDDGIKGLDDDGMNGLRDDAVYPVVDVEVITDDSVDNSDSDGLISGDKVDDVDVVILIPKSKIIFTFLKHEDLIQHIDI